MIRPRDPNHLPALAAAAVMIAAWSAGALAYPHFASWLVARSLVVDSAVLGIAALGATFVILSGGIDLSVGSVIAVSTVIIAALVEHGGWHPAPAAALAIAAGAAFGAAQGAIIHVFRLPAFLVTLAGLFLARGLAFAISPRSVGISHPFIASTINESWSIPLPVGTDLPFVASLFLVTLAVSVVVLAATRFGRSVYAIGDDEASARLLGVPVGATRVAAYAAAGGLSGLAGAALVLYQQSGDPAACRGFELDVIAAVVVGGTLLRGGVGSAAGTAVGVMILGLVQALLAFQGTLSSWWVRLAIGLLLLVFIGLQRAVVAAGSGPGRGRGSSTG